MRTVLSEEAVAAMGRIGCGEVIQQRVVEGGESEARGLMLRGRWAGLEEGMMCAGVLATSGYWSSFMVRMERARSESCVECGGGSRFTGPVEWFALSKACWGIKQNNVTLQLLL
jgi:hypothetical protein